MLKLVQQKGKRWSDISKCLKCARTENAVKNRFNSLIKKDKHPMNSTPSNSGGGSGGSPQNSASEIGNSSSISSNKDLTDNERYQVSQLIEKLETRLKNGYSLIGSSLLSCNSLKV